MSDDVNSLATQISKQEVEIEYLRRDLDVMNKRIENMGKTLENINLVLTQGKGIWWFVGIIASAVIGAAALGDKIASWFK